MVRVGTINLPATFDEASMSLEDTLSHSQKAVFLSTAVLLIWSLVIKIQVHVYYDYTNPMEHYLTSVTSPL